MKSSMIFFMKILVVGLVLSQTVTADTGYNLIGVAIDEPISLTICGLGLLYLGLYSAKNKSKDVSKV